MDIPIRRRTAPTRGGSLYRSADDPAAAPEALEMVRAYHERTKHRLKRYAIGPEALDWSSQPDPFRCFAGAPRMALPLLADHLTTRHFELHQPGAVSPLPLSLASVAQLLELSLGLSAWKQYGPDRWALRCNPSSGNLHPTEGYIICRSIPAIEDGLYHYLSRDHVLEQRCLHEGGHLDRCAPRLWVGLSSIHWREAWKYGERAFRYCQLDIGHALGALRYAAASLGWRLHLVEGIGWAQIANQLGLDRSGDFSGAETEEAELLLEVIANGEIRPGEPVGDAAPTATWYGRANVLDPHPMYHWPVIDEVAEATRFPALTSERCAIEAYPPRSDRCVIPAPTLIRRRRSAQHFDNRFEMQRADFYGLLNALLPRPSPPWDVWEFSPRLHPVFFVHRVEGLASGLYILVRNETAGGKLRAALRGDFDWSKPPDCPEHLPFFRLAAGVCEPAAKTINCHQAIASDSAFALGLLADYETTLTAAPWRYRQLYWEAGLLGQALYLEAEAIGLRGTGIGCYFDDTFHELLGITDRTFQSLYHFTVGYPVTDSRILSLPPYPEPQ